jgi:hypothetical protein
MFCGWWFNWSQNMNWLTNLFWDIRFKIEDAIYDWKNKADLTEWDREDSTDLDVEEIEVKPKKKKAKKKAKNKK